MAVKKCYCASTFQDARYGKGRRVHNALGKDRSGNAGGTRCTVCGDTKATTYVAPSKGVKVKFKTTKKKK